MVSANLNIHFSPSTRQDHWVRLRSAATRLEETRRTGSDGEKILDEVKEILEFLDPLESLWAFPGRARFDELVKMLADDLDRSFMFAVSDITDLIESRDYRQSAIEEAQGTSGDDVHYFEVLVVGHISGRADDFLRHNLLKWRSNQDKFVYEVVVVPSMSEALVAVLLVFDQVSETGKARDVFYVHRLVVRRCRHGDAEKTAAVLRLSRCRCSLESSARSSVFALCTFDFLLWLRRVSGLICCRSVTVDCLH